VQGSSLFVALSPVEHADADIMPTCVNHSKIGNLLGLARPYAFLNRRSRYIDGWTHFGLGLGDKWHYYSGQEGNDTHSSHQGLLQLG
jgi:hypothetical protein